MQIVIVLLMVIVVDCLQTRQIKEINQRPQYISYSNNILHHNPEYPDQRSESTVRVSYNYNNNNNNNNNGVARINHNYNQQPLINQQSQLFNVGYSVKFANNNNHKNIDNNHQVAKQRPKYNDGEIITGTRKQNEQVQVPEFNMSPQQFVSNALIESKKSKLSGIKTKFQPFQQPINVADSQLLIKQANLSPTTQKFYKNLEHVRIPQQSQQQYSQQQKYTWQNLSPSVEIIQSAEIPVKYADNEAPHFDHSKALGKSEEFDYTNIMNLQQQQQQSKQSNIVAQVPVDTSLLQEPVRIDTRLVQEAIRQNYETNQLPPYVPKYQIASQIYSNNNDNNSPKFPYKIYGQSPQLLEQTERQPRFVQVQYNLQRDLQPPPLYNSRYQRRIAG